MKSNGFKIYDKVYQKLLELEYDELTVKEFYSLVENIRIPKEKVLGLIEEKLLKMGLTTTQVDRICSSLSFKIRMTRRDARNVERHLREEGLISRKNPFTISIKQKEN